MQYDRLIERHFAVRRVALAVLAHTAQAVPEARPRPVRRVAPMDARALGECLVNLLYAVYLDSHEGFREVF